MCYKILQNLVNIDCHDFSRSNYVIAEATLYIGLSREQSLIDDRHFFTNCIVNRWNSLSDTIVPACTVSCFKRRLEMFRPTADY